MGVEPTREFDPLTGFEPAATANWLAFPFAEAVGFEPTRPIARANSFQESLRYPESFG